MEGLLWLSPAVSTGSPSIEHKGWTVLIAMASVGMFLLLMLLWFVLALIVKWRFQFSILSLLVLVVAVAIPFSWLATEMKAATKQREVVEKIGKFDGNVTYDFEPGPTSTKAPPAPLWLWKLLGNDFFGDVAAVRVYSEQFDDAALANLRGLRQLQVLDLGLVSSVTDAGLVHLKGLTQLRELYVRNTIISDTGLTHLKGLAALQNLDITNTEVTDAGLDHLEGLTQLRTLHLGHNTISDAGLRKLRGLTRLQLLDLEHTTVTDARVGKPHGAYATRKVIPPQHQDQRCWAHTPEGVDET